MLRAFVAVLSTFRGLFRRIRSRIPVDLIKTKPCYSGLIRIGPLGYTYPSHFTSRAARSVRSLPSAIYCLPFDAPKFYLWFSKVNVRACQ